MIVVIGSGPSGIACAQALVERGHSVTIIDGGQKLEENIETDVDQLSKQPFEEWDPVIVEKLKGNVTTDAKGVQIKYLFGSDFPYRFANKHITTISNNIGALTPSLAIGGFSNVWGSAILPYSESDLAQWPINLNDLKDHYEATLRSLPVSALDDDLSNLFPLYCQHFNPLEISEQAQSIFKKFAQNSKELSKHGVTYGASRLAVNSKNCAYCGLCLFGCPYGLIYNSSSALVKLIASGKVTHQSGIIVKRLINHGQEVEIHAQDGRNLQPILMRASKVFLAAGVISSTKILLSSLGMHNKEVELKVSEYFMLPCFQLGRTSEVTNARLHTLAQAFIEVDDPDLSQNLIHMQLYGYSELYSIALNKMLRILGPLQGPIQNQLARRLMVIQGYLHSNCSSKIVARLDSGTDEVLELTGKTQVKATKIVKRLGRKMLKLTPKTGLLPALPMLNIGKPGEGRHAGGSFPMSLQPKLGQCDRRGVPVGLNHVHVVDSTNFPTVPAPTITLTTMANARRIVSEAI